MVFLAAVFGLIAWNATVNEDSHQVVEYRKYVVRNKAENYTSVEELEEWENERNIKRRRTS